MTRSEWLRKHYSKEMVEADKMLMLVEYHQQNPHNYVDGMHIIEWCSECSRVSEGPNSDPGSEED